MFSNTTSTFRGGLAVFVRNGIPHSSFPPDVDHPSIEYTWPNIYTFLCSSCSYEQTYTLANYIYIISNSSNKLVLLEDFNCKHFLYGAPVKLILKVI